LKLEQHVRISILHIEQVIFSNHLYNRLAIQLIYFYHISNTIDEKAENVCQPAL
jgi:hypothetical protein